MTLPKVSDNYFQERDGVHRVSSLLNQARLLWRETPNADVGIDGQVEFVNDEGQATGALVAVQIKSGNSYLIDGGSFWKYYPLDKHRTYWEHHALPVLLMLHDPGTNQVYWVDARRVLRSDQLKTTCIPVPKSNLVTADDRHALFESVGGTGIGLLQPENLLKHMVLTTTGNANFPISYFDIFAGGLTDIGRKIFFSAGLCWDIAEARVEEDSIGTGSNEHDFFDGYLSLLAEQNIAVVDYSDFLIDRYDRQVIPTFIAPLTSRGRAVRDLARKLGGRDNRYELTEGRIRISPDVDGVYRLAANLAVGDQLQKLFGG